MKQSEHLRQLLSSGRLLAAPGAYDAITAKMVEKAGFEAVYVTGSGVSLTLLGQPDLNTVSYLELKEKVDNFCSTINIPVIVDIDTGFGGPLNLIRLVRDFERMGVAAVQIEDQIAPKRCGHELGRRVVSCEEMLCRIRTIAEQRSKDGLVIVARTDARTEQGLDEAIRRANVFLACGADVAFVESPESREEVQRIAREVKGPVLFNNVEGGRSPFLSQKELSDDGVRAVIYPNTLTRIVTRSIQRLLNELKNTGTTEGLWSEMLDHKEVWSLFDNAAWLQLESRYTAENDGEEGPL